MVKGTPDQPSQPAESLGSGPATVQLPADEVPEVAPLAIRITTGRVSAAEQAAAKQALETAGVSRSATSSLSNTTAAAAMRDEEVERTRLFIRMGWFLSIAVMVTVPFVKAPVAMSAALCGGLVVGMIVSYVLHQRFADPQRYTERALMLLAIICVLNGHLGVMYYGAFTAAPLMIVVGIHFVARTEAERVARWILVVAIICYSLVAALIITGTVEDPGVFASNRAIDHTSLVIATVFVLGTFLLAYETARMFRLTSLAAIEDLQKATRLASEREALMDELRADLERALAIGGPGRYTDQVVGSWKLGIVLGRGAIGEVYEATHVDTGEGAAVKLLRRELLADATQVARFVREARASAAIESPHVARVLGASHEDAVPYLVVERLSGHTLSELLRREPRLTSAATIELCRHAGAGLDAAAAAKIVHRDLKPGNLMRHGELWKILDFGVATFVEDTSGLTHGEAVGTPHYMSPEQAQGKPVDARADLYALGAIVYRCATGSHPFHAADTTALLYAVVHRMPPRPGALADLPPDLDRWCAIALAKSPDDRFGSGRQMMESLAAAYAGALEPALRDRGDALNPEATVGDRVSVVTATGAPASPAEALKAEEVRRTRDFMRVGWLFALGALAVLPVLPGEPQLAYALAITMVAGLAGSVWLYLRMADPKGYDLSQLSIIAVIAVAAGQLAILYTGAFSAAPLAVALGLYFFCRTEHVGMAIALYALAAGSHAVEAVLVIAGAIDDPGFYPISDQASVQAQIAGQLNLQLGYALVFWLARITRRSSLRAIEQLQRATRLAAQRDVQVAELRRDLARVLEVGGPGRFTDHAVGAWKLGNVLGRGAMGEVYEATNDAGAQAAAKVLRRELLGDPKYLERFLREVRVAGSLESPHVVKVLDASASTEAMPYLVMERLHGETLHEMLRAGKGPAGDELVALVEQAARVLELARDRGVVHRDIKPQNLMLTADGIWKVLDFGIALLDDSSGTLTRGGVVGTPAYMPPEQARGDNIDHRADVYALAATVYRCVTGRAPFSAADTPAVLYAVAHEVPLRPSWLARAVSDQIDDVLAIGLAKNRELRFATAGEFARAFAAAVAGTLPAAIAERAAELPPWSEPLRPDLNAREPVVE